LLLVPLDREGTLRKAEKLLRQGQLDLAIAEYRAVIEDRPADWNTANTLGDLYVRAGAMLAKACLDSGDRAHVVPLQLQAEAGEYRDVSKRLEQRKVQMGSRC
jgi:Flp pilus assembly protein TadD